MKGRNRRARWVALLAVLTASLAIFAGVALAAGDYDVKVADRLGFAEQTIDDGAIVQYLGDQNTTFGSAGSGVFDSFVRMQGNEKKTPTQKGYNTDGTREFDTKAGAFTHSILLSEIPTVEVGGSLYWEFFADINDNDKTPLISLDDFELYLTDDPNLSGYPFSPAVADEIYDYSDHFAGEDARYILINDVNQGSGRGDLRYLVPQDGFDPGDCTYGNPLCTTYLVLFSEWGGKGVVGADNYGFDGGFEEWKVKKYPILQVSKDIAGSFDTPVTWDITKDFDESYELFVGQTVTHGYEVSVTPTFGDPENTKVYGTITIVGDEDTDVDAQIVDLFDGVPADIIGCSVPENGDGTYTIAANATVTCSYELDLDAPQAGENVARATFEVDGVRIAFEGSAEIVLDEFDETLTGDPDIDVTDTNGESWSTSNGSAATWTYTRDFDCPADETYVDGEYSFEHINTATITQTGQSDIATVDVTCYAPVVTKDATPAWEEFYDWDIFKNVDSTEFIGFAGDDWAFNYDVDVVLSTFDELNFSASGTITVVNGHPTEAMTVGLSDAVGAFPGVITADADCAFDGTDLVIPAASSATCDYTVDMGDDLDGQQATEFTNVATATLGGGSFTGDATFTFGDVDPTLADGSEPSEVNATDDNATPGDDSDDHTAGPLGDTTLDAITYQQAGMCPTETTEYEGGVYTVSWTNTAVIDETDDTDSETVDVTCYAPVVTKDATPYFTRYFEWDIDKSADQTSYEVLFGESVTIDYTVIVSLVDQTDDGWGVRGEILIQNPNPDEAMTLNSVTDLAGGIAASVECPSYVVPAGGTLTCTYDTGAQSSPDSNPFGPTNVATASFGGADWTGEAAITFGDPTALVDEDVEVTDTYAGYLGTVSHDDDPLPAEFTYSRTVEASELECGDNRIDNTATFTAVDDDNDTGQTGSADETVWITVICGDSRLTPTNTECNDFVFDRDNPSNNLEYLSYDGDEFVTNVVPGAMFYWIEVNHSGGPLTVAVIQTTDFSRELMALDIKFYDDGCSRILAVDYDLDGGDAVLTTDLPAGTYYMQVRYDPKSLIGAEVNIPVATFSFDATINGTGEVIGDSLTLQPR